MATCHDVHYATTEEAVKKSELLSKLAGAEKIADHVSVWALPKEQLFPLDTPGLVKMAADSFSSQVVNMTPPQLLVAARSICSRAQDEGIEIESSLAYKYAGARLSDHFESFLEQRKIATAHLHDQELDKLLKVAQIFNTESDLKERVKGLDKVAAALETFDREHGLAGHWGQWVPDPSYSTYGLTLDPDEVIDVVVKVADRTVKRRDFDEADWSLIEGKVDETVVDGLKAADDKLAAFDSLPAPEKEVIYQSLFPGE
jgi:hypothetical protein